MAAEGRGGDVLHDVFRVGPSIGRPRGRDAWREGNRGLAEVPGVRRTRLHRGHGDKTAGTLRVGQAERRPGPGTDIAGRSRLTIAPGRLLLRLVDGLAGAALVIGRAMARGAPSALTGLAWQLWMGYRPEWAAHTAVMVWGAAWSGYA